MKLQTLLLCLTVIIFTFCARTLTTQPTLLETYIEENQAQNHTQIVPIPQATSEKKIEVISTSEKISLVKIVESKTDQGNLKVDLQFNNLDPDLTTNGSFLITFFSQNGTPVSDPLGWFPITLAPNSTQYENVLSPSMNAAYYKIEFKENIELNEF